MRLLIDGYNLLHATDLFGVGELEGALRGSREALLAFLAERLTPAERRATVIVCDAQQAPPGLPDRLDHDGIDVRFARGYADADAMIEALLEGRHRAKGLTVVSSDRRVQRAARSSGAAWIDSPRWFAELRRRKPEGASEEAKPLPDTHDQADWEAEFSDPEALAEIARQAAAAPPPRPLPPVEKPREEPPEKPGAPSRQRAAKRRRPTADRSGRPRANDGTDDRARQAFGEGVFDPFPPGYADDLLDPDEDGDR